jgi:glutamate 5-kinase
MSTSDTDPATDREPEALARGLLGNVRTVVVKIGSSLLTDPATGLARQLIADLSGQISALLDEGKQILLVSSGAVAEGVLRLGLKTRPETVHQLQAAAAVGQMGLVQAYETAFSAFNRHTAVVLLTHDDLADRQRYLNARATLKTLLDYGVVPIVNENDSVATDEIRFGDNDTLAALVTNLLQADLLVLLTDTNGLYESDPRAGGGKDRVSWAEAGDRRLDAMVSGSGFLGRGGMITKLEAARLAARSGANTVIADGSTPGVLRSLLDGAPLGTLLTANLSPLDARKRWIAGQLKAKGQLRLDAGAVRALTRNGVSLLPVGVTAVEGDFSRGDLVRCVDPQGHLIAQGLSNYSSAETGKVLGSDSRDVADRLGYSLEEELIHRDNLVILADGGQVTR